MLNNGVLLSYSENRPYAKDHESIEIHDLYENQNEFLPIHVNHSPPFEKNEKNREKEENNLEGDSKHDSFYPIAFYNNALEHFSHDIQVNTKLHSLACSCANRPKISKFILFHNWKIDCAL